MRPLAPIYSHRVPEFMETQVGFNPIQKSNLNPKRKVKRACRSTGRSTDPCHGRPARSTAPNRERALVSRSTGPVDRSFLCTLVHAGRPGGRPASSTGRPGALLVCSSVVSRSFVVRSLCYLLPSPLSPLSHNFPPR